MGKRYFSIYEIQAWLNMVTGANPSAEIFSVVNFPKKSKSTTYSAKIRRANERRSPGALR